MASFQYNKNKKKNPPLIEGETPFLKKNIVLLTQNSRRNKFLLK